MFGAMSPQKRERLLAAAAGIILLAVLFAVLPALFANIRTMRGKAADLQKKIDENDRKVKSEPKIRQRLADLTAQSLSSREDTLSEYQRWLTNIAKDAGLRNCRISQPQATKTKNQYTKFAYTLNATGRLEQLAEFLRSFHKTNYLHLVQGITPKKMRNSNDVDVTVKIELLSLPQVRTLHLPAVDKAVTAATAEDKKALAAVRSRAILAEYVPPKPPEPVVRVEPPPPPPPPPPRPPAFDESPYCYVTAILDTDGKPQCWIDIRTSGKSYKLSEGEMFRLGNVRCYIKKIETDKQRVQIEAAGGIYIVKLGKSFAEFED